MTNCVQFLCLRIKGEKWVSYPLGIRFPRVFARLYPFRGRGCISRLLWLLNWLHLDRVFLEQCEEEIKGWEDVAFFWPAATRSEGRYYGYRIKDGKMTSYLKFAILSDEMRRIKHEAENVHKVTAMSFKTFSTPKVLSEGYFADETGYFVEYTALPEDAKEVPHREEWLAKVQDAGREIAQRGLQHGDFAWHNFKRVGNALWVLDWEELSRELPRLVDEITCLTAFRFYVQKRPKSTVLKEFELLYLNGKNDAEVEQAVDSMCKRDISMGRILKQFLMERKQP